MSKEIQPYVETLQSARDKFLKVAPQGFQYEREYAFACQALMKTDYAMKVANANRQSVALAMLNVGSTGLTLNPANAYAYLVPRDGQIVLDISYKGLIKIATDSGSIAWARADIVYADDQFTYHGPASIPDHQADPFKTDRGEVVGAYCIAKTKDGDILTEVMPMSELAKIRDKSMAYVKKKAGPWVEWFEQMAKKAVIKRASKTWPYTNDKLAQVIEVANTSEGGYDLQTDEERDAKIQTHHEAAVGRNYGTFAFIKGELARDDPDLYAVAEAWYELSQEDQMAIWGRAPTKGGLFTVEERRVIKEGLPKLDQEAA